MPLSTSTTPTSGSQPALPTIPRLGRWTVVHLCGLFFLSRLFILAVAAVSHMGVQPGLFAGPERTWAGRFLSWDSAWYLNIAKNGYFYNPHGESSVEFYPLYPMLLRAAIWLGWNAPLTGYAISQISLLIAVLLLWKLAALETRSDTVAERSVLFLLFCPGSMWFGMVYAEAFFLLTMIGCLYSARQGRWLTAGACGLACALTRTPGLLLAGFLALEGAQQWWERNRGSRAAANEKTGAVPLPFWRRPGTLSWPTRMVLGTAGPVVGHASYLIFLQLRFGDWRAQQKSLAAGWGGHLRLPWTALSDQWQVNERVAMVIAFPFLLIVVGLGLASMVTLKRPSYTLLILALCALYVCATPGDALTRYLSTTAPAYIVMAQLAARSRLLEVSALIFSVGMMAILTVLLSNGYHIT